MHGGGTRSSPVISLPRAGARSLGRDHPPSAVHRNGAAAHSAAPIAPKLG